MFRPILAVTSGDPSGIGPEVVLKSLRQKKIHEACRPLVIGDARVLSGRSFGVSLKIRPIVNPAQARYRYGTVDVLHVPCPDMESVSRHEPSLTGGALSAFAVQKSVELALTGIADGVVHAPISKTAWKMAGVHYPGHTEMIADLCGCKKAAMAIVSEPLRTVMVTRHIPLKDVSRKLKVSAIVDAAELAAGWLKQMGMRRPRIAVCALNPHAGERGLIGREELSVIGPAVKKAALKLGLPVAGPLPADSAFKDHKNKRYDCLVTLYHDQSLIPLKLFNADRIVNITLGLPFPRTSPGHGTAYEIAGKNIADFRPMMEAILTAARLCRKK